MPVFLEKFVLPLFAATVVLLAWTNPMGFDTTQRVTGAVTLVFAAYFVGHTVYKSASKNSAAGATVPAATSPAIPKDNPPQGTAQPPRQAPKKHPKAQPNPAPSTQPDILIVEQKEIPSTRNTKYALRVTLQPTKTIQPVHLRLQCDGPLIDADLQEPQRLNQYSYGVVPNETNVAEVTFVFPPIDSNRVVVVVLFSDWQVKVTNVRNVY